MERRTDEGMDNMLGVCVRWVGWSNGVESDVIELALEFVLWIKGLIWMMRRGMGIGFWVMMIDGEWWMMLGGDGVVSKS
jgi:hypothetical protein